MTGGHAHDDGREHGGHGYGGHVDHEHGGHEHLSHVPDSALPAVFAARAEVVPTRRPTPTSSRT